MTNNKQQTAVGWYNEQLNLSGDMAFNKEITLGQYHIKKQELFNQAKEMEKAQIIDAANSENSVDINYGDQYYEQTYGGKK